jgi:hypothetical protein
LCTSFRDKKVVGVTLAFFVRQVNLAVAISTKKVAIAANR